MQNWQRKSMRFSRQDLDNLTVLDIEEELYERLGTKSASLPRMQLELEKFKEEYITQIEEKEKLEAEEKAAKEEFLRKQRQIKELKEKEEKLFQNKKLLFSTRWNNLTDKRMSLHEIGESVSNPDLWFKNLTATEPEEVIEKQLSKLESVDYDLKRKLEQESKQRQFTELRNKRNEFLYKTDWTQSVTDSKLDKEVKKQYRLYRKYLRELPKLIENKQVLDFIVMTFNEWKLNSPIFEGWNEI